jgi:hypothetical protein
VLMPGFNMANGANFPFQMSLILKFGKHEIGC